MEPLDVGISIGTSVGAIGYFMHSAREDALALRHHSEVRLVQFAHGSPFEPAAIRVIPDSSSAWLFGRQALARRDHQPNKGVLLGSPVLYLDQAAPLALEDHPEVDTESGLHPTPMMHGYLRAMVDRLLQLSPEFRVESVVMTAPLGHSMAWNSHVQQACSRLDLALTELLTEPAAVLTHYAFASASSGHDPRSTWEPGHLILIADWGGESLQMTLVKMQERTPDCQQFSVVASISIPDVGGHQIDQRIGRHLARLLGGPELFRRNPASMASLLQTALEMKMGLSANAISGSAQPVRHFVPMAGGGREVALDGGDFRRILKGDGDAGSVDIPEAIAQACTDLHALVGDIEHVLLAGGSANLPTLSSAIRQVFGDDIPIHAERDLDQIAVRGAVLRAAQYRDHTDAGPRVSLAVPSLLSCDVGITMTGTPGTPFLPVIRAGVQIRPGMRFEATMISGDDGEVVVNCVMNASAPSRGFRDATWSRLARLNLGPIPAGRVISFRIDIVDRAKGNLTISWTDGRMGPVPITLATG